MIFYLEQIYRVMAPLCAFSSKLIFIPCLILPFIHPDEQHEGHNCGKKETKGHGIKDRTQPIVIRKIAGYGRSGGSDSESDAKMNSISEAMPVLWQVSRQQVILDGLGGEVEK